MTLIRAKITKIRDDVARDAVYVCDMPMSHINCMYAHLQKVWQPVIDMQSHQKTVLTGLQTVQSLP